MKVTIRNSKLTSVPATNGHQAHCLLLLPLVPIQPQPQRCNPHCVREQLKLRLRMISLVSPTPFCSHSKAYAFSTAPSHPGLDLRSAGALGLLWPRLGRDTDILGSDPWLGFLGYYFPFCLCLPETVACSLS